MFHWKGGVIGGLVGVLGYVIAHADPISALLPAQYAGTVGTLIGTLGFIVTAFSNKVGQPKTLSDVIPPSSYTIPPTK